MRKLLFIFCIIFTSANCITFAEHSDKAAEIRIPFSFGGRYGYINNALQVVIKPQFNRVSHFSEEGFAIVYFGPGASRVAIIDITGKEMLSLENGLINHIYGDLYHLNNVRTRDEEVIIRLIDNNIIARQTHHRGPASNDGYMVAEFFRESRRFFFIDFEGNWVLQHLTLTPGSRSFFEQRAVFSNEDWVLQIIDMEGTVVGDMSFKFLGGRFSEGLIPAVSEEGIAGYVNRSGEFEFLLPNLFMHGMGNLAATNFRGGYAAIQTSETPRSWRIINNQGQMISENIYAFEMREFSEGLSLVRVLNNETGEFRKGYVNTRGEFLVRPILESADDFRNGFARIRHNGREGLLTTNGKVIWSSNIMQGFTLEEELR